MRMKISNWLLTGSLLWLSACASTPPTNFYVLEPLSEPSAPTTGTARKHQIGVGPISIPALIERPKIVTRTGANGIEIAEFHQWGRAVEGKFPAGMGARLSLVMPDMSSDPTLGRIRTMEYRIIAEVGRSIRNREVPQLETTALLMEKHRSDQGGARKRVRTI